MPSDNARRTTGGHPLRDAWRGVQHARALTRREADAVPVLEFEAGALEFAFPLLDVGLVLVELEDEDVELALQHVDLALRQLLLAALQQLLLGLLLQGGARQLFFPGAQLLDSGQSREDRFRRESAARRQAPVTSARTAACFQEISSSFSLELPSAD